jgi:hypothetical protein
VVAARPLCRCYLLLHVHDSKSGWLDAMIEPPFTRQLQHLLVFKCYKSPHSLILPPGLFGICLRARHPPPLSSLVIAIVMIYSQGGFCSCGAPDGAVHHPNCTPFFDFDFSSFLTGGDQLMNLEGINGESSMYAVDSGLPIGYEHPTGSHEDGGLNPVPPVGAPYMLNPSTGADHHAYYGAGMCLYESFDNGSNASHLAPALPTISTQFAHAGNIFPSPNSASTDTTGYTNTELHPVGSDAMRTVSTGRRKKDPILFCPFQGCSATFTAKHNYKCPYFFTYNISSN